ncbi:hypothetical protein BRC68_01130 [Halobacteriales archaeon QH_6_64_20]|nr:MAG: hypothetical protein BRC68_01130 [Halobacteriales archaeon QH_6_64_20]
MITGRFRRTAAIVTADSRRRSKDDGRSNRALAGRRRYDSRADARSTSERRSSPLTTGSLAGDRFRRLPISRPNSSHA